MKHLQLTCLGVNLILVPALYQNNGRTALSLYCEDGEPFADIAVNIVEASLNADEFCVHSWDMPSEMGDELLNTGFFADTKKTVQVNHVTAPIWKITSKELLSQVTTLRQEYESKQ